MRSTIAIACVVLAATCRVAVADVAEECRQGDRPEVRHRACTEIITSPTFGPDEKALAYRYRGEAHTDAGDVRSAIADFTESIRLKKDNMSAFADRGRANFSDGNLAGSIADYSEAIRLLPASADLYVQRGHVYIVSEKVDAAISDLTEAIRLNPSSAQALSTRGAAYVKKGDYVRAQQDYTAAIALFPFPAIYQDRGFVYETQGMTKDAIADFRYALLHDPSLAGARAALKRLGAPADATTIEADQRVRQGKALAEKSCGNCHAVGANGISPDKNAIEFRNYYRGQQLFELRQPIARAIRGTHEAMKVALSDKEIDTIIAYINSLSTKSRLGVGQ